MTDINPFVQGQVLWAEHQDYIERLSHNVARAFFKLDAEDIRQEIFIFLWEKEDAFLAQGRSAAYVRTCIHHVAWNYALKERNRILLETDTFYYHAEEVKSLLPAFFMGDWAHAPVPEGAKTDTANDNVEIMCDFQMAFERLNDTQRAVLQKRYADDEDLTDAKDRQALSRATRRFVEVLNQNKNKEAREHVGPGSRRAITNANAQYASKSGWDD